MKSILISIRPEWAAKILNREKILELRKSCPKELPCEVYIYVTKDPKHPFARFELANGARYEIYGENTYYACGCSGYMSDDLNGYVVAKFTLNKCEDLEIDHYTPEIEHALVYEHKDGYLHGELIGSWDDKNGYQELSCVRTSDVIEYVDPTFLMGGRLRVWHIDDLEIFDKPKDLSDFGLKRAPQSWCYVEEEA